MSLTQRQRTSTTDSAAASEEKRANTPNPEPFFYQRALQSTAHLSNLLPTGTLLAFQLLIPISTKKGSCDAATRCITFALLITLAVSCFLACFTDSFKASDGQVYYGFVTPRGLLVFGYPATSASGLPDLSKYRLTFIDAIHALLSVFVFGAVALRDKNVLGCFYPAPGQQTQEVLDIVPISIGLICSLLFVIFPARRHGIGNPVTSDN